MKYIFELNHPKHYYQFKYVMRELERRGHTIVVLARDKDVLLKVLEEEHVPYQIFGAHKKNMRDKILGTPRLILNYWRIARREKADVIVSKASFYGCFVAKMIGAKSVIFPDSEVVKVTNKYVVPLATKVVTPGSFGLDYGKKHVRIGGLFEDCYLAPSVFVPDKSVVEVLMENNIKNIDKNNENNLEENQKSENYKENTFGENKENNLENQKNIKKIEESSDIRNISTSLDQQSANEQDSLLTSAQSCSTDIVSQSLSDDSSTKNQKNILSESAQTNGANGGNGENGGARPYAVLRFVGWYANHDVKNSGFTLEQKKELISAIEPYMRVYISSEKELPEELQQYRLPTPANKIHHVLAFADLYLGDSQTMATEAALLGTPAVRSNSFVGPNDMTNFKVLEEKHGLLCNIRAFEDVLVKVNEMAAKSRKAEWLEKRDRYFEKVGDANAQIVRILVDF